VRSSPTDNAAAVERQAEEEAAGNVGRLRHVGRHPREEVLPEVTAVSIPRNRKIRTSIRTMGWC